MATAGKGEWWEEKPEKEEVEQYACNLHPET